MTINVVDAPMGIGKTSAAINMMNELVKNGEHILYITPYTSEFDRIISQCKGFVTPEKRYTKTIDIQRLISQGANIVSTHSLFFRFNETTIELAYANNYILIMDETANILKIPNKLTPDDARDIMTNHATITKDDIVEWTDKNYDGIFNIHLDKFQTKSIKVFQLSNSHKPVFIQAFPFEVFNSFKSIYILSYLFNCSLQKYYYDLNGCKYNYLYVKHEDDKYYITDIPQQYDTSSYKQLINICDSDKLNAIGDPTYSLSTGWYRKNLDTPLIIAMKNNIYNYFHNIVKSPIDRNMWTVVLGIDKHDEEEKQVPKIKNKLKGKGYTNGFVSLNMRATNEYRDRDCLAYLSNIYMNPVIKNYLISKGIEINEDMYALSEMIQWIWRSAIRDGKPINIYIPSLRMRTLLINWLDNLSNTQSTERIEPIGSGVPNSILTETQMENLIKELCQ